MSSRTPRCDRFGSLVLVESSATPFIVCAFFGSARTNTFGRDIFSGILSAALGATPAVIHRFFLGSLLIGVHVRALADRGFL